MRTALDDGDDVLRSALLDLRALSVGLPACVAGWSERWRYAWPRDVSFVATALARTGHPDRAAEQLTFLQEVQRHDGWFEARYDLRTRRTPDERVAQLDGSAWVVWGAHQLAASAPDRAGELLVPLRQMLVRSAERLIASLDAKTAAADGLLDYWELVERSVTLGTAASVLAGLRSATEVLPLVGEHALAARTGAAAASLATQVHGQFGPLGYPRMLDDSAADAAVTFLAAPIGGSGVDDGVLTAMGRAQVAMARPGGGVAPGGRVEGRRHQLDPRDGAVRRRLGRERPARPGRVAAHLAGRPPHRRRVVPREGALRRAPGGGGAARVDRGPRGHRAARAGARVRRWAILAACRARPARRAAPGWPVRARGPRMRSDRCRVAAAGRRRCAGAVVVRHRGWRPPGAARPWPGRVPSGR